MERLSEGDQPIRSGCSFGKVLGQGFNPADVRDPQFVGSLPTFGEHRWIGIETDRLLEQVSKADGENPRAGAGIEESPAPVQIKFLGENGLEVR